jgi:hypothetical protein
MDALVTREGGGRRETGIFADWLIVRVQGIAGNLITHESEKSAQLAAFFVQPNHSIRDVRLNSSWQPSGLETVRPTTQSHRS